MSEINFTAVPVRPCIKCGATERNKTGKCAPCKKAYAAAQYAANTDKHNARNAAWSAANPGRKKALSAAWAAANKERCNAVRRAWRAANPDKVKAADAALRAANTDKIRTMKTAWRAANPAMVKAQDAAWREANPDKVKAITAAWRAANPEAIRINNQNRRAREKKAGGRLSSGLAATLFKMQKGKCPCCKQPLGDDYHLDHKMPLALGGSNTDNNMQLLRAVCNMQKSAKHPVDFMQSRGYLL